MLTQVITKRVKPSRKNQHGGSNASERYTGDYGTEEHKKFIHKRVLLKNTLEAGMHVYYKGRTGVVVDVINDFNICPWRGLECLCVEVYMYDTNASYMCHPNQLKVV